MFHKKQESNQGFDMISKSETQVKGYSKVSNRNQETPGSSLSLELLVFFVQK